MDDPYKTLGVARDASEDVIHRAYLKLAKLHHPDLNPGNAAAEARFKAISAANTLLSDAETRGKFDRGEIDASGQERRPQPNYRDFADSETGRRYSRSGSDAGNWGSGTFDDMFGSMFHEPDSGRRMGGQDHLFSVTVDFLNAVNGTTRRLSLPGGADFDVKIPAGTDDGQVLRLRGKGGKGLNGGAPGDALIEVHVAPHAVFHRDGPDIRLDLPVSFAEAVLGGHVDVPTPAGPVRMKVPPHSDTGTKLRLRGRGVPTHGGRPAGDLIATLTLVVGPTDAALEAFLRNWAPDHPANPRQSMEATL
ncbi:MAG: DnaJ C-terminal domain-containing protein [Ancalomicrobiaceae bacterium]|nr:DnaJ C-terminal domain-containing protein [Ancalomicrobiaceae bacterium]